MNRNGSLSITALAGLLAWGAIASCSRETETVAVGSERGACYPNGTCNEGLSCFSQHCVRYDAGASSRMNVDADSSNPGSDASVRIDGSVDTDGAGGSVPVFDAMSDRARPDLPDVGAAGATIDASDGAVLPDGHAEAGGSAPEASLSDVAATNDAPGTTDAADAGDAADSTVDASSPPPRYCDDPARFFSIIFCDDFDKSDYWTPVFSGGTRALVSSPISTPYARAFTVPMSDAGAVAAGQRLVMGGSVTGREPLGYTMRLKLDGSCQNAPSDATATIAEFVMQAKGSGGGDYRSHYAIRLVGMVPSLVIWREPFEYTPEVALGQHALPTGVWLKMSEHLIDGLLHLLVNDVDVASEVRGELPSSQPDKLEFYIGLDAQAGWSDCTITFDDVAFERL